eukprot:13965612-Alexandrium_andersonii.AAC.1
MISRSAWSCAAKWSAAALVVAAGLAPPAATKSRLAARMSSLLGPGASAAVGSMVSGKQSSRLK